MASRPDGKVRPLRARPGARFECRGDGLCCADIHLWGPVTEREKRTLELIAPNIVTRRPSDGTRVLQAGLDGRCLFWADGCRLHAALGPHGKPATCRKFPLAVTATPRGGRITTSHRCSCRSMPSGPPVTPEEAGPSLRDGAGRVQADQRIGRRIPIGPGRSVPFDEWERMEAELLERLAVEEPEAVLDAPPFPELSAGRWQQVADALDEEKPETRFETAMCWFADALRERLDGTPPPTRERPWAEAFDRAERHAPERSARDVYADWIADDLWGLVWAKRGGSLRRFRAVAATRLAVARTIARRLEPLGLRPDRAAAESVTISDLTGSSDSWAKTVRAMKE